MESAFAVLKRGIIGVYHHITPKHTGRYVDEFAFRLNDGNVKRPTMDRLDSFVDGMAQKRLPVRLTRTISTVQFTTTTIHLDADLTVTNETPLPDVR
jgi:hypothetical protein